ncbi:hypothetical protein DFJ73DRAFT_828724 [Zopfochytrium polystomum]|nr:hypothetical protein DFJ73DRAFT_828724 [Zopfochytrium polystomum]
MLPRSLTNAAALLFAFAPSAGLAGTTSADGNRVTDSWCNGGTICVSGERDVRANTITFTLSSSTSGWVAFGTGSRMAGSTMFVAYADGNGGTTLSQRQGGGHYDPSVVGNSFSIVSTPSTAQVAGSVSVSFSRSMDGIGSSFIWAVSGSRPSNPGSTSASIREHDSYGYFSLDFTPSEPPKTTSSSTNVAATTSVISTTTSPSSMTSSASPIPSPTSTQNVTAATVPSSGICVASFCDPTNTFCVHGQRDFAANVVTFTVTSRSPGWVGIGIGSTIMSGAVMYVGYNNGANVTLSQRTASGHDDPTVVPSTFTLLPSIPTATSTNLTVDNAAKIAFSFNRTADSPISSGGSTKFIYAFSSKAPANPASSSSSIVEHDAYGSFALDLSTAGTTSNGEAVSAGYPTSLSRDTLLTLHGVMLFLAWAVFPAVGIFTARYLKNQLGHNWYRIHLASLGVGTVAFTILGLLFVELSLPNGTPNRFLSQKDSAHRPIGVALSLALLPAQVILGYISNGLWKPDRTAIPWWDQLHWWVGRSTVLLAVIELYLGLVLYSTSVVVMVLYWLWIAVVVIVFALGQWRFGVVHHVAGSTPSTADKVEEGTAVRASAPK